MFLSVQQVATMKGVSRIAVADAIRQRKLPAQKVGKAYIISEEDIEKYKPKRKLISVVAR